MHPKDRKVLPKNASTPCPYYFVVEVDPENAHVPTGVFRLELSI